MFGNGVIKEVDNNGNEVPSKLVDLLRNPNWFQGGKEFMRQTNLFHSIFGNEYLYELYPIGREFEEATSKALFTIPSNWMEVIYNEEQPFFTFVEQPNGIKYIVRYKGREMILGNEYIIHLNDDRVNMNNMARTKSILKGESKLTALTPALNNLKMAYETRGVLLKNRGALGILSNATSDKIGAIPLDPTEKDRIQEEYSKNYGGLRNQRQIIISSADLRWQQMSISPDKMGLYKETEEDFAKIKDAFGMPDELFVRAAGTTYENQKQARKGAYIDTIIPEANEWIGAINNKHRNGAKTKLIIDYFHLPVFKEDLKDKGDALQSNINALSKAFQDGAIDLYQYISELEKLGIKKQQ
jgi:phage portal protein BeeE